MLHGTTKAKKCSQEKSCLFPFAIIHILMLVFLTSCPSYRPKYFKTELRADSPAISHPLLFVIWNSLGSEQWLPNFAFQWLFIILIIDLTAFDVIDFKPLFGGEEKKTLFFFGSLQYSILIWILSFCTFSAFLFGIRQTARSDECCTKWVNNCEVLRMAVRLELERSPINVLQNVWELAVVQHLLCTSE